jgi:hypothetical protein
LTTPTIEERIVLHHDRVGASLRKRHKSGFDFVTVCRGLDD